MIKTMNQYGMTEWCVPGKEPAGSWADTDIAAEVTGGGETKMIRGFYAGDGIWKVRFYAEETGGYHVKITGAEIETREFDTQCLPAAGGQHGMVRADGTHFRYADGTWFYPFGTTVYALAHQDDALAEQTLQTLSEAPFNKVRICLFPKHYDYNHNEPPCFPFSRRADAPAEEAGYTENEPAQWDPHRPNPVFWDRFEGFLERLGAMGIQADLIVFHPYDRWGFSKFGREQTRVYLEYLTRRFSAFPNLWWSMANEYDIMDYTTEDWNFIEQFLHDHDPYGHLLSSHEMIVPWDFSHENVTHICHQIKNVDFVSREIAKYRKPLMVDECRYEGNLPRNWGNISAQEMVRRFWVVTMQGGYCTHGETYMSPDDIIWWARGGILHGQSPARIAFLRGIIEGIGGPLTFNGKDMDAAAFYAMRARIPEEEAAKNPILKLMRTAPWEQARGLVIGDRLPEGHYGDQAFIRYYDEQCTCEGTLELPEEGSYTVEVIDSWEMTRTAVLENAHGTVRVPMPSKPGMALLATKNG